MEETRPLLNKDHQVVDMAFHQQNNHSIWKTNEIISKPDATLANGNAGHKKNTLSWHDINVFVSQRKKKWFKCCGSSSNSAPSEDYTPRHILRNVNGVVHSNQLLAVMGSSGAGKTTLLNVLTMRRSSPNLLIDGDVRINGKAISREQFAQMSAYVQQQDLFIATLTVREQLIFQALLRMDRKIPYEQRLKRVEEVISELGLRKCANTIIGDPGSSKGISGGEMKRLAFAAEVLTNPPLMFCDEPTSGLDSFMAHNVISVLRQMSAKGKIVVCTIHQPSSEVFSLFDRILLMAEGRVAFLGNREDAYDFFKTQGYECPYSYNPADFYILTLAIVPGHEEERKKRVEIICDQFDESNDGQRLTKSIDAVATNNYESSGVWATAPKTRYKASWWAQFRAVLWRSWLTSMRDPHLLRARFFQSVFVAVLLGIVFFGQKIDQEGVMNINGAIFLLLTNMTFQNVFGVIHVFCLEVPVFYRENDNGMYSSGVYYWARTLSEVPLFILIAVIFTAICYWMVGLYPDAIKFLWACLIVTLVAHASCSFGYLMSTASPNITVALSIAGPLIAPLLFFGGYFLNSKTFPYWLSWMQCLSWFRYSNEALQINQWDGVDYIVCNRGSNTTCYRDGLQVLSTFNFEPENFLFDMLFLAGQVFVYRFIGYICLLMRVVARR
ncbi:hypothetical protein CHUAL_012516 [Chamberlinius hualienensis]